MSESVTLTFDGCEYSLMTQSGGLSPDNRSTLDGSPLRGWCNTVPYIGAKESSHVSATLSLSPLLPPMTQLTFLAVMCIQDVAGSGSWTVVQRRKMQVKVRDGYSSTRVLAGWSCLTKPY